MSEPHFRDIRGLLSLGLVVALVTSLVAIAREETAVAQTARNVVLQASFERSAHGWDGFRARLERVRGGHLSRYALRVSPTRRTGAIAVLRPKKVRPATVADGIYSAKAWVRSGRAGRICLRVRELVAGKQVGAAKTCRTVGRRWTRLSFTGYEARSGGHRLAFSLARGTRTAAARRTAVARSFLVDRMSLRCRKASGQACGSEPVTSEPAPSSSEPLPPPPPGDPESWWYSTGSYWKTPVRSAPLDARSTEYISFWKSHSSNPRINLVAAGCAAGQVCSYAWSLWHSDASDPLITVRDCNIGCPLTFRAPAGSRPAPGDGEITIVDHEAKRMYEFGGCSSWTPGEAGRCSYSSSSDLTSNGLDRSLPESDSNLNWGHRGLSCMTFGFAFDEVQARDVAHMIKITVPSEVAEDSYVFPYVGTESGTGILPEGLRVRLKDTALPKIEALANPYAKAMATALYTYGSTISDKGGSGINIKVQNPGDWAALGIDPRSLSVFTVDDFEVVQAGWKG
jgi:hypothetical protein